MVRLRGGSPKNMRQGQYWVRRHLDDRKRSAASERRVEKAANAGHKAEVRAAAAADKSNRRRSREYAAAKCRLGLWTHFEKLQNELKRALDTLTEERHDIYSAEIEFSSEEEAEKLEALQRAYQEHADWLNNNHQAITKTAVAKHIQNIKKMLTQLGKGLNRKTIWNAQHQTFGFGDITLDLSAPKPVPERSAESTIPKGDGALRLTPHNQRERTEPLIAPVGIFNPMFVLIATLAVLVALVVSMFG